MFSSAHSCVAFTEHFPPLSLPCAAVPLTVYIPLPSFCSKREPRTPMTSNSWSLFIWSLSLTGAGLVLCVASKQQSSGIPQGKVFHFCMEEIGVCSASGSWVRCWCIPGRPCSPWMGDGIVPGIVVSWILYWCFPLVLFLCSPHLLLLVCPRGKCSSERFSFRNLFMTRNIHWKTVDTCS